MRSCMGRLVLCAWCCVFRAESVSIALRCMVAYAARFSSGDARNIFIRMVLA
jgi:hypothetical protein